MKILRRYAVVLISLALITMTLAVFWRVAGFAFTTYDDDLYVTDNPAVKAGLNRHTLAWAFHTTCGSNWHPLTWISFLTDSRIFGLNAGAFHSINLLFHLANVVLLFLFLRRLTKSLWRSAFVAALFAIHPLHVESVAWIAERKDVLSTLFWILTMWAYVWYTERPNLGRQALVLVAFALGLMAKPMLVTLPLVLLLLDYWPLRRFKGTKAADLIWEKLPMFSLSFALSLMTFKAQQSGGSMIHPPVFLRIENAFVSSAGYIVKMIVPRGLAVLYPYPENGLPLWEVLGSAALLVCVTVLVLKAAIRHPYLAVGWLWYVITLLPVIGLVQVGSQAMADRYTYVPLIGLFLMVAWFPERWGDGVMGRWGEKALAGVAGILIAVLAICAWVQVGYWRDSITLFQRAVAVTEDNDIMYTDLGVAYDKDDQIEQAIWAYNEAVRILPEAPEPHNNLAVIYYGIGEYEKAWYEIGQCRKCGFEPKEELIRLLSEKMPEPE